MRCSGVIELEKGIGYCFKKIEREPIHLTWISNGKQLHDCYFCSFECLHVFIHHAFWEQECANSVT